MFDVFLLNDIEEFHQVLVFRRIKLLESILFGGVKSFDDVLVEILSFFSRHLRVMFRLMIWTVCPQDQQKLLLLGFGLNSRLLHEMHQKVNQDFVMLVVMLMFLHILTHGFHHGFPLLEMSLHLVKECFQLLRFRIIDFIPRVAFCLLPRGLQFRHVFFTFGFRELAMILGSLGFVFCHDLPDGVGGLRGKPRIIGGLANKSLEEAVLVMTVMITAMMMIAMWFIIVRHLAIGDLVVL